MTHLLHCELFEHRVILVEPQPTEPIQDTILLWGVGLGLARCLCVRLGTGLGVRQRLGARLGQVKGLGLRTGLTAGLRMEVVL